MHETNWAPGLVVLAIGLFAGIVLAWRMGGRTRAAPVAPKSGSKATARAARTSTADCDTGAAREAIVTAQRDDLLAQRDAVFTRLRELEQSSATDPEARAAEKRRLELQAAGILRSLDELKAPAAAAAHAESGEPPPSTGASWQPVIWGGGMVVFAVLVAVLLGQFTSERGEGGSMTGNTSMVGAPARGAGAGAEADPRLAQLQQLVASHPDMLEFKLDLAQAYLVRDRLIDAFEVSREVMEREPENPRAITYQAVVRMAMGQSDMAMDMLDRAVESAPDLTEAWVQRGLVALQVGRFDVGVASLEKALEQRPDGEDVLAPLIERARAIRDGEEPPPTASAAAQQAHAPMQGHPPAKQAAASPGNGVRGTIELAPEFAGKYPPGTTIFLVARDADAPGPPAAVKRMQVSSFPTPFSLDESNAMNAGTSFPQRVDLEIRIDSDGDAMTRDPSDPVVRLTGVAAGAENVKAMLQAAR